MHSPTVLLVALDLGDHAATVLDTALAFARPLGARVVLTTVVTPEQTAWPAAHDATPIDHATEHLAVERATKGLEEYALAAASAGVACTVDVLQGFAAEAILDAIGTHRAGTVVMGTHARRGVSRAVVGSVAEGVLRGASVPVIVVRVPE